MSDDDETNSGGPSGPPPDDTAGAAVAPVLRSKVPKTTKRQARGQTPLDLRAVLAEPLRVTVDGKPRKMDPVEAAVRKQAQKSLGQNDIAAIKNVIDLAIEHKLIASPPPAKKGGALCVPAAIGREHFEAIFKDRNCSAEKILAILELHREKT